MKWRERVSESMQIPVITFNEVALFLNDGKVEPAFLELSETSVSFPAGCFGVEIIGDALEPEFSSKTVPVFARPTSDRAALDQVYLFLSPEKTSVLCRLVRSEEEGRQSYRSSRRKSFMTPTPLHIPTSQVSPIPSYTHASHYLKPLDASPVIVTPAGQSARLCPLVWVHRPRVND